MHVNRTLHSSDILELLSDASGAVLEPSSSGCVSIRAGETAVLEPISPGVPFTEFLPSWNVDVPDGCGFAVEGRFAAAADGDADAGQFGPWVAFGGWGERPPSAVEATSWRVMAGSAAPDEAQVLVDILEAPTPMAVAQLRIVTCGTESGHLGLVSLSWVASSSSHGHDLRDHEHDHQHHDHHHHQHRDYDHHHHQQQQQQPLMPSDATRSGTTSTSPRPHQQPSDVVLDVAPRSQFSVEPPELGSRLCGPTSVAMLLDWHGIRVQTPEVASLLYDAQNDIYGNWNRAVQGAYALGGCRGCLRRLSSWREVRELLEAGVPLVVSISAEEGELRGAPYSKTSGHLLVLCGLLLDGTTVAVRDPAAKLEAEVPRLYSREDMERVWLNHDNGVAYVLMGTSA